MARFSPINVDVVLRFEVSVSHMVPLEGSGVMPCERFFIPGEERFDEASGYATEETVEICEDCARAMWEHQEESKVY